MPEWTASQLHVINSDAREIICSAAAGSGKTAVMVERIVRFLREGADPSAFLVVTFTNAAAAEMREKIRKRMQEEKRNEMIRGALDQMDAMQISTIHAFCQQLLRNQFQDAGIDPNFQICDPTMTAKLFHEAFTDACGACAAENGPLYDLLRARYEPRQAEKIIQSMYSFLMSLPDPFGWLERQIDSIPDHSDEAHPWFAALRSMALEQLHLAEVQLARMYDLLSDSCALASFHQTWQADYELFHVKQTEIETNAAEKKKASFARMKQERNLTPQEADWRDRYREIREEYKKRINRIDELLMTDPEECLFEWKNMRESLVGLRMLLMKTQEIFTQRKRARNLMDFQDLEQETVRILSGEQTREEVRNRWRYLFVDECQDISDVQNHIIDLLSSPENHLFMVGDVKQSIYRFRLADPTIFLNRIRKCRESGYPDRECIYLQSNFRSRPEILEVTNRVFRTLMKESVTEIGYGPEEELIPGRKTEGSEPVRVEKIQKQGGQQGNLEAEADYLVEELKNLLQEDYPEKGRKYQYRDCVILMPAVHTDGPILAEMLEKRNVPVFFDGTGDYYQLREIQIIRNLLEWIDHPLQDLPLLSVLQEEPFSFTEEELARIRLKHPDPDLPFCEAFRRCAEENTDFGEKCGAVERKLREWQGWAETRHVAELIWDLYHDTGIYYILGVEPTGEAMQANLRMLAQQAEDAESRGILTLRDFLAYMKDQQLYGDQQAATLLGEQDNLVRIMTIHKSKGLQFPVVFCAGMDKSPVRTETREIMCHTELGLCVNYRDPEHRISRPTLAHGDLCLEKGPGGKGGEKVRLLYVAMTRAQERLYLLTCQEANPGLVHAGGGRRILSAKILYGLVDAGAAAEDTRQNLSTGYSQGAKPYEIRDFACR